MGRRPRDADGQETLLEGTELQTTTYSSRERAAQRELMAERRAEGRLLEIPAVRDPSRRERCRFNLELFCLTYFPFLFYLALAPLHHQILAELEETILRGGKIALAAPRGFGKTTITLCAIIWAIVYGHSKYIVLVCAEGKMAMDRLEDLKGYFEDEDSLLAQDFPEACTPVIALEGSPQRATKQVVAWPAADNGTARERRTRIKWGVQEVRFARVPAPDSSEPAACSGTLVVPKGLDQAIRGLVRGPLRPDLVVPDDPQTDESARSELQTETRNQILRKGIEGLVGPGHALTVVSLWTVIQSGDLADRYTSDEEPDYRSMRFRALPLEPSNRDLVEQYLARVRDAQRRGDLAARAAHAWYLLHQDEIEAGAAAAWPENYVRTDVGDNAMAEAQRAADLGRAA
jgi:hypothetical protein